MTTASPGRRNRPHSQTKAGAPRSARANTLDRTRSTLHCSRPRGQQAAICVHSQTRARPSAPMHTARPQPLSASCRRRRRLHTKTFLVVPTPHQHHGRIICRRTATTTSSNEKPWVEDTIPTHAGRSALLALAHRRRRQPCAFRFGSVGLLPCFDLHRFDVPRGRAANVNGTKGRLSQRKKAGCSARCMRAVVAAGPLITQYTGGGPRRCTWREWRWRWGAPTRTIGNTSQGGAGRRPQESD